MKIKKQIEKKSYEMLNNCLSSQLFVSSFRIKYKIEVTEGTSAGMFGFQDHRFCICKHKQLKV